MPRSGPDGKPTYSLDKSPPLERKYSVDAEIQPTQQEVDHLCNVWAEVGRAILMRRRGAA